MDLPDDASWEDGALALVGGFEVNNLTLKTSRDRFYEQGYLFADQMVHSFIQEVYFPFYTLVVAPARVHETDTWLDTRGDPVEYTLQVFAGYYDRPAIRADNSVDPDLIALYRENFIVNILWTLADPMLYQSARGFGAESMHSVLTPWRIDSKHFSWTWGTLFNPSPLGYELHLTQYLWRKDRLYQLGLRASRPFDGWGVQIGLPELYRSDRLALNLTYDFWDQSLYGSGHALDLEMLLTPLPWLDVGLRGYWKQYGYLLGKPLGEHSGAFLALRVRN